jgi:hypothetical protein
MSASAIALSGELNELHIGLNGRMSALFLIDLTMKTHHGSGAGW